MVATLALFIALGGSAVAARTLINGKAIKKGSVPANRLKPNSVGGKQVRESSLGEVKRASRAALATRAEAADRAGSAGTAGRAAVAANASLLGGLAQSAFVRSDQLKTGFGSRVNPSPVVILNYPGLFRVETDGDADNELKVTVRDQIEGATTAVIVGDKPTPTLAPVELSGGALSPIVTASASEISFIVWGNRQDGTDAVAVRCSLAANTVGSFGTTVCFGVRAG